MSEPSALFPTITGKDFASVKRNTRRSNASIMLFVIRKAAKVLIWMLKESGLKKTHDQYWVVHSHQLQPIKISIMSLRAFEDHRVCICGFLDLLSGEVRQAHAQTTCMSGLMSKSIITRYKLCDLRGTKPLRSGKEITRRTIEVYYYHTRRRYASKGLLDRFVSLLSSKVDSCDPTYPRQSSERMN